MITVHIVLSYDLGLKGDYTNLYVWLDKFKAIECGNGLAALAIDVNNGEFNNVYDVLKQEIAANMSIDPTDRIYMIMKDSSDNQMKGKFLFGTRKRAPWEGYYRNEPDNADVF